MSKSKWMNVFGLIISVLLIIFGAYTLTRPDAALESATIIYGVLAILMGVFDIAAYVKLERRTGFGPVAALVTGMISVIAGVLILFEPVAGTLALVWLFPIWFICHCVSRLMSLGITRMIGGNVYYYFSLVVNIIGLVVGIMMCFDPLLSMFTMAYMVGFYLILLGVDGVVSSLAGLGRRW